MNHGDITEKSNHPEHESGGKDWKNPHNPEEPEDSRNEEQFTRQVNEAKRRKGNLIEKDHIDKPKKTK